VSSSLSSTSRGPDEPTVAVGGEATHDARVPEPTASLPKAIGRYRVQSLLVSLRSVARAAGMSRGTPYGYFEDKQAIVDAVRAAGFDRLTKRCETGLRAEPECMGRMRRLGWEVVRFAVDEPAIYALMFSQPVFHGELAPVLRDAIDRFRSVSRPPLEEALRTGAVRGDPEVLRRVTWAAFHGLVSLYLHGHVASPKQLESDFDVLNDIIGHGILVSPTPAKPQPTRRKKRK
jgi:AcrR family transcriptional regulator